MIASTTRGKYAISPRSQEPSDPDERLLYFIDKGKKYFPSQYQSCWESACNKLANAGYGALRPLSYARHSPKLVKLINPEVAINLAASVSLASIKVNRAAAELLPKAAIIAASELKAPQAFTSWVATIEELIRHAPESSLAVLERTQNIVSTLTSDQFRSWVLAGLRSTGDDTLRQIQYFSFTDPESEKWFRHEAGDIVFTDIGRR
ncbi:MAG: hypothetical protein P8X88_02610, partial [Gammaproteobacteria bacterium]